MLILSRKLNESIVIDGRITVTVVRVQGDVVKLGIEAAADVPVHRQEIYDEIQQSNLEALASGRTGAPSGTGAVPGQAAVNGSVPEPGRRLPRLKPPSASSNHTTHNP